jgi:hypothetical protein
VGCAGGLSSTKSTGRGPQGDPGCRGKRKGLSENDSRAVRTNKRVKSTSPRRAFSPYDKSNIQQKAKEIGKIIDYLLYCSRLISNVRTFKLKEKS